MRWEALVDPEVLHASVTLAALQTGRAELELAVDALHPEVTRLAHVGVGGEDLVVSHRFASARRFAPGSGIMSPVEGRVNDVSAI
jgi:hypothetical protein